MLTTNDLQGEAIRARAARFGAYRQLWQLLIPQWRLLVRLSTVACLLILTEGIGLSVVLLLLGSINASTLSDHLPTLAVLWRPLLAATPAVRTYSAAIALIVIMGARGLGQFLQQITETGLRISVEEALQQQLFSLFHSVQLSFIQRHQTGALLTILMQYTVQIGQLIAGTAKAITALFTLGAYIIVALFVSWKLSLLALLLMTVSWLGLRPLLLTQAEKIYKQARDALAASGATAQESLAGIEQIHLFNNQAWSSARFQSQLTRYHTLAFRGSQWTGLVTPLFGLLNALLFAGVMVGSNLVEPDNAPLRLFQLTLFLLLAYRLGTPLRQLNQWQAEVAQSGPHLETVLAFLQRNDKPLIQDGTHAFTTLQQGIHLENVTYSYVTQEAPALCDVTMHIAKGKITALVGASGAGKSTLINLIARLYTPTAGRIWVDGVDLQTLTLESWRAHLAIVNQDPFLFHDSILANLRFGKADATAAQMQDAICLAQAHAFITDLPAGMDTSLQERGARLSGGQRQRIALARALLRQADFLILDEATNELDAQTERAFQMALAQERGTRTILLIAHRLATVRHADQIYVLEKGRVVEEGTHDTLMRAGGTYYQLVQAQALAA